ncbi:hypothetical protein E2C01_060296 [Portunus trituberculatus]|uniref:Uncharacterized protein n=1 Tax=Portunus trituberculatus TaxID=210409 RepID=A0A5B7H0S1_PORTR|nr:hypothetical protein [Portunus trituberculatus]
MVALQENTADIRGRQSYGSRFTTEKFAAVYYGSVTPATLIIRCYSYRRALCWKAAAAGNSDERRQPRLTGLTEDQSRPESNPNRMPGIKATGRALREGANQEL